METVKRNRRGSYVTGQVERRSRRRRRVRRGERARNAFTLVEILLVVLILGLLAGIVIPQFSEASSQARLESLRGNLQTVRSQIQLYKVHHEDRLPGQAVIGGDVAAEDFVDALMNDPRYGSYLQRFPVNLYIGDPAQRIAVTCVNDANASPAGNEGTGWWFNAATGDFRACSSPEHVEF